MLCDNITVKDGVLHFAGQSTVQLAQQYGTPLYLLDEDYIRRQCRVYKAAFARHFGPTSRPLFASKACCFTRIYEIMREEGMGIDVVSPGEVYTARRAGFDLRGAYFHGNNKTDADIAFAMECGVGCFVADGREELDAIEREAARRGLRQKVLLEVNIGGEESKSGFAPSEMMGAAEQALKKEHVEVCGVMTIPPVETAPHANMVFFHQVHTLYVDMNEKLFHNELEYLSMGMSGDYQDAIRAGANMVRVGTAIFGARHYN